MSPAARTKIDRIAGEAVDAAREALLDGVPAADVGDLLGSVPEGDRIVTHLFACTRAGYRGWQWAVTVVRASRAKAVTVDEVVLLPGADAITAPTWVPWRERIKPGDLGPGDLLPTDDDDARLVPGYLVGDSGAGAVLLDDDEMDPLDSDPPVDTEAVRMVTDELGLGRVRVLSLEGRELAAERWYDGEAGPLAPIAQSAPAHCSSCGFLVQLAGPLSRVFGVCANAFANDDGKVVSIDHGCGAHSEAQLSKRQQPGPLPDPVLDTLTWDELDAF